jgi:hypothetical protein
MKAPRLVSHLVATGIPVALGASFALTLGWGVGRMMGDRGLLSGLLFYIPTPVLLLTWLGWSVGFWRGGGGLRCRSARGRRERALALVASALVLFFAAELLGREMGWRVGDGQVDELRTEAGPSLKLVHWNVFRNYLPWSAKIERLRAAGAQVYVLNEVPRQVSRGNWALRLGPNMDYALADSMVVACQGRVLAHRFEHHGGLSILEADCRVEGRRLRVMAVDMPADPTVVRGPLLERLVATIEARRPDLVAGDFNAPRRSLRLRHLPEGYVHAYEAVGSGWPFTWPMPWPVLAIDQCIVGPAIRPYEHRYVSVLASDHRMQVLRFGWSSRG